jgi:hypothetical protein
MLLPVSVKQLDEGGVSVLRDAATDEEFEITYTQLKRSSDAKGADRYFYGVCRLLARSICEDNGVQQIGVHDTALPGSQTSRRHARTAGSRSKSSGSSQEALDR